jgi:hypothetical protein
LTAKVKRRQGRGRKDCGVYGNGTGIEVGVTMWT